MKRCKSLLGVGGSKSVVQREFASIDVTIKRWNWKSRKGLDVLHNELHIYNTLHKQHRTIKGTAVPRVFSSCTRPRGEAAVIVAFLGDSLVKKT